MPSIYPLPRLLIEWNIYRKRGGFPLAVLELKDDKGEIDRFGISGPDLRKMAAAFVKEADAMKRKNDAFRWEPIASPYEFESHQGHTSPRELWGGLR